jgi:hypothetical protein
MSNSASAPHVGIYIVTMLVLHALLVSTLVLLARAA